MDYKKLSVIRHRWKGQKLRNWWSATRFRVRTTVMEYSLSKEAKIIGYADIAVAIIAKELNWTQNICAATCCVETTATGTVNRRSPDYCTSRKKWETITLNVDRHIIKTQTSLKYHDVIIDARLSYETHIEMTCERAARVISALSRILADMVIQIIYCVICGILMETSFNA